uniref:Uncharacterized protein n=1 Tax=Euplotes crassus TaxID=5936 RepID=A0A7S3KAP7_EUPCR|mmetsp:Transcript_18194/g.17886  ORF Transcript_18194/g.17886 Transcript_18194/m.17886 type:complete len:105 (+) Transcript_18194:91-405(+)
MVPKDHDLINDPQKNPKNRRYSEYHLEDIQRTPRENQGYKRKSNERYNRYREDYYAKYIQPYPFWLPHPAITRTQAAKMQELKTLRKELARLKAKNMRHHLVED